MSDSIRRRSSSRQMLQNLIRVTAQRSQEDAEEAERERRRRARERPREEERTEAPQRSNLPADAVLDDDVKPSTSLLLEEDEGFSDWSHRLEVPDQNRATEQTPSEPQWKPEAVEEKFQREQEEQEPFQEQQPREETSSRKGARMSFSSSVFLPQDSRTSYLVAGTMMPGQWACREEQEEEKKVMQQQREEICLRMETRREEPTMADSARSGENGGGRLEESKASAAPVLGSSYGPMSPTFKKLLIQFYPDEVNSRVSTENCTIMERTESLRRRSSSNSPKKTPPPLAVAKIDKRLEQYTQAVGVSSKEGRLGCQALTDLTGPTEPVASKKNHSPNVASAVKDADGLKVADLINQWVRGSEDGSSCSSSSKPEDSSTAKKYKFVVTGHSKYEKVSVDGGVEDARRQAAGLSCETPES